MKKNRIPETDCGIQDEVTVAEYDQMQRHLRDRGWIETDSLLRIGITKGRTLEIGFGPGYLGLEWLKRTQDTYLTGLDISPEMRALANRNAEDYGLSNRTDYRLGNCAVLPFPDEAFDAVFSSGSLHEWEKPLDAFDEIWRVLKPGGKFFISDLRRDMNFFISLFLRSGTQPKSMRAGLLSSIHAAYTSAELVPMLQQTKLEKGSVQANLIDLSISGAK